MVHGTARNQGASRLYQLRWKKCSIAAFPGAFVETFVSAFVEETRRPTKVSTKAATKVPGVPNRRFHIGS
jgi:hypothetical protein